MQLYIQRILAAKCIVAELHSKKKKDLRKSRKEDKRLSKTEMLIQCLL